MDSLEHKNEKEWLSSQNRRDDAKPCGQAQVEDYKNAQLQSEAKLSLSVTRGLYGFKTTLYPATGCKRSGED